jgi:sugar fermentation stimulation protein A
MLAAAMLAFPALVAARFVARPNRYLMLAESGGRTFEAACRDPGRLGWLLRPGLELRLRAAGHEGRRTAFDVVLARQGRVWVSLVPTLANRLFADALERGAAPGLRGARVVRSEPARGKSRFDFLVRHRGRDVLAEIKSVGLVEQGRGLFPDAPTARGTRHLRELALHARSGGDALLAFVVQRPDVSAVSPHAAIDPEFAAALAEARRTGVRLLGFASRVDTRGAAIVRAIPVVLPS